MRIFSFTITVWLKVAHKGHIIAHSVLTLQIGLITYIDTLLWCMSLLHQMLTLLHQMLALLHQMLTLLHQMLTLLHQMLTHTNVQTVTSVSHINIR